MKTKISEILGAFFGTVLFWLFAVPIFLFWIPRSILSSPELAYSFEIGIYRYLGLVPIFLWAVVFIYCSVSFVFVGIGTPIPFVPTKKLIVTGFYKYMRNPLYLAAVFALTGEGILFQSAGIIMYGLVTLGIFHLIVLLEEGFLKGRFGDSYKKYCESVPRWIPRLTPYREEESDAR